MRFLSQGDCPHLLAPKLTSESQKRPSVLVWGPLWKTSACHGPVSAPCATSCRGNIRPVVVYLGLVSLNVRWKLRRLPDGHSLKKSQLEGKKSLTWRWRCSVTWFSRFYCLVTSLKGVGMGLTTNTCVNLAHVFLSIRYATFPLYQAYHYLQKEKKGYRYLNSFSRNNSKIIYTENTGPHLNGKRNLMTDNWDGRQTKWEPLFLLMLKLEFPPGLTIITFSAKLTRSK